MSKVLSEAGRLFLADYLILKIALADADQYLETVIDEVHTQLEQEGIMETPDNFQWKFYKNASSAGWLDAAPIANKDVEPFRQGQWEVTVRYRDVRWAEFDLTTSTDVQVFIEAPLVFLRNLRALRRLDRPRVAAAIECSKLPLTLDADRLYISAVNLIVNDSKQAIDLLSSKMIECCNGVTRFIREITRPS